MNNMTTQSQPQMNFENSQNKEEQSKKAEQPETVVKKENTSSNFPAKTASPAIPQKLVEAGLSQCFLAPKKAFLGAGGTEQQFAREINFAMQSLMGNDFLLNCAKQNPEYLVEAIKNVSLTGLTLNPELRLGYLIPYKGKIAFRSSYMGKVDILIRSGMVKWIEANLVYEKDLFKIQKGNEDKIIHEPDVFASDRGNIKGGYWIATLPSGLKVSGTMSKDEIDTIKQRSESVKAGKQSPWDSDYEEMAKKTIINRAFKSLPKSELSDSIIKALEVDGQYDREEFEEWRKSQPQEDKFNEEEPIYAKVIE